MSTAVHKPSFGPTECFQVINGVSRRRFVFRCVCGEEFSFASRPVLRREWRRHKKEAKRALPDLIPVG